MKLSENVWFVGVYKKNESTKSIHMWAVLKGGLYLKHIVFEKPLWGKSIIKSI